MQKMLNRQELEAQRAAVVKKGTQDALQAGYSQLHAEDSIMVERTSTTRAPPEAADPLMDPSAFVASNQSRTAGGAQRKQMDSMKVRQRDRRGVYQSIDLKQRSPKQQEEYELRKAEERLRTIEMISKYREDKIKAEFRKLESDLKAQDQKNAIEKQRAKEKRGYMERQRKRTLDLAISRPMDVSPPHVQTTKHHDLNQRQKNLSKQKYKDQQRQKMGEQR